jgi:pantetheine-phosphate adenylyltransferase
MADLDYAHGVYAGSFDPITLGHVAIIERASRVYGRLTVAIGVNPSKNTLFTLEERRALIERSLEHRHNVQVAVFEGLLVHYAVNIGAGVLVRGLRALTDFDHEFQLALGNRDLAPAVETVFMMTDAQYVYVSSSLIKEIAKNGGDVSRYVPGEVQVALRKKYQG